MSSVPEVYTGNEPFIYISYAHKDKSSVYPFIAELEKKYRVWYDRGLQFGQVWVDEIAEKLRSCAIFLFMVSENALSSANCRDELAFAQHSGKPMLHVLTESSFELPTWFRFHYMQYQACRLYVYPSGAAVEDLARKCPDLAPALKPAEPVDPA